MEFVSFFLPKVTDVGIVGLIVAVVGCIINLLPMTIAILKNIASHRTVALLNILYFIILHALAWLSAGTHVSANVSLAIFVLNILIFWLFPLVLAVRGNHRR